MDYQPDQILEYWFSDEMKKHWFFSTAEIDKEIKNKFEQFWIIAKEGTLSDWENTATGCLALCIILDQLPLNMFRGEAKSFSSEQKAVAISKHAISKKYDEILPGDKLAFLFMPLMHSENMSDQDLAVAMFEKYDMKENARFAKHHRDIVNKYGRFPHRNKALSRTSSKEEIEYLNSDEAFKG